MFFSIDTNNGVAIYEQIVRQVKFAIADKTLRPGQLLPSVRLLSQQLAINPNTINRAFQQLQAEEILESLRGRGLAVCEGATRRCVGARKELLSERFGGVITEALHAGLSREDIHAMVMKKLDDLDGTVETVSSASPPSADSAT